MSEAVQKMDELFTEEREQEAVPSGEVMGLIGSLIRKAATDESLEISEVRAMMQRAYLLTKHFDETITAESDEDTVGVPLDLLEAVRKDTEGPDAEVVPISVAMMAVAKRLGTEEETPEEPVAKSDDEVDWVMGGSDDSEEADWGKDPEWS